MGSESEKDRANNWRIAALTALVALVAAAAASGASILTAREQIASARQQSRDDFIRTQRQTAYAKYVADVSELRLAVFGRANALTVGTPMDASQQNADVPGELKGLLLDVANIQIIGSDSAYDNAAKTASAFQMIMYDVGTYKNSPTVATADMGHQEETVNSLLSNFVTVAKADLDN